MDSPAGVPGRTSLLTRAFRVRLHRARSGYTHTLRRQRSELRDRIYLDRGVPMTDLQTSLSAPIPSARTMLMGAPSGTLARIPRHKLAQHRMATHIARPRRDQGAPRRAVGPYFVGVAAAAVALLIVGATRRSSESVHELDPDPTTPPLDRSRPRVGLRAA